jgi:hypothetical protein
MHTVPRAPIAVRSTTWRRSRRRTPRGRRSDGSAESASTAPPIGSVAAPVKPTSPLYGRMIPGVASPCRASSAAITVKAVPSRTVRPSLRRAPSIVSANAAAVAATAVRPTPAKCVQAPNETWSCAKKPSSVVGRRTAAAAAASAGCCLTGEPHPGGIGLCDSALYPCSRRGCPSVPSSAMSRRKRSATVQSATTRSFREKSGSWYR